MSDAQTVDKTRLTQRRKPGFWKIWGNGVKQSEIPFSESLHEKVESRVDFNRNYMYNIIDLPQSRGECMDYMTELAVIAKMHGGIVETKIAARHLKNDAL